MNGRNKYLAFIIIAGIVVAGLFGWGYINAINEKNRIESEKLEMQAQVESNKLEQQQLEQTKLNAEKELQEAKIEAEKQAQIVKKDDYLVCLQRAEQNYNDSWNYACALLSKESEADYNNCFNRCSNPTPTYSCADGGDPASFCREGHPKVEAFNCAKLRSSVGKPILDRLEKDKDNCVKLYD